MAPRLELFAFRYRDSRSGKWIRARYRAERHEIAARHAEFELIDPPEIRDVDPDARYCNPDVMGARRWAIVRSTSFHAQHRHRTRQDAVVPH